MEDDASSVISDQLDRQYLASDDDDDAAAADVMDQYFDASEPRSRPCKRSSNVFSSTVKAVMSRIPPVAPKTEFEPGTLDVSKLKMLQPPQNASISTTKELMKRLKDTLQVQDCTATHELGWYIDRHLISNMYQWIVELHSFEASLPLAKDMKRANMKSIVLELRFTNSFPFSPPFARIVRPRFLPFLSGGGGHVTAGGAICLEHARATASEAADRGAWWRLLPDWGGH